METQAQKRANAKYKAKSVKQISLKFFPKDYAVFDYARSQPHTTAYIIELIKKDMESKSF